VQTTLCPILCPICLQMVCHMIIGMILHVSNINLYLCLGPDQGFIYFYIGSDNVLYKRTCTGNTPLN
jgi:hypothetical protein